MRHALRYTNSALESMDARCYIQNAECVQLHSVSKRGVCAAAELQTGTL